jgi:hypothetical protein
MKVFRVQVSFDYVCMAENKREAELFSREAFRDLSLSIDCNYEVLEVKNLQTLKEVSPVWTEGKCFLYNNLGKDINVKDAFNYIDDGK